jgi:hypothetical protein
MTSLKRAFTREDGSATIEFVILFPVIMTLFLSAFEVSIFLTRSVMLDRAVDLNVRLLRLGTLEPATQDELKRRICDDALIFKGCPNSIMVELREVSTADWVLPDSRITCVDRDAEIQPAVDFNLGRRNEVMLVRACAALDPFFGTTPFVMDLPQDASGAHLITAMSTFVNEP